MTALKCILVGDIKHIELREDELKTYEQMRAVVMKWAVPKRIEKERGHAPMDIDQADKEEQPKEEGSGEDYGQYGWGGDWNGDVDVDWLGKGGKGYDGKG